MTDDQPNEPSRTAPFQFRLRTLLLLTIVLGSSLAVFGPGGIAVFGLVLGLAIYLALARSFAILGVVLVLAVLPAIDLVGLAIAYLLPIISHARDTGDWMPYLKIIAAVAVWLLSVGTLLVAAMRSRNSRTQAAA